MDDGANSVSHIFGVYRTVKQMIYDRGYYINQEELNITLDEFKSKFCNSLGLPQRKIMCFQASPTAATLEKFPSYGSLWVEFCEEPSVGIKVMRNFCIHLNEKNFSLGILIYQTSMTPNATKLIPTVAPIVIETFHQNDLIINVSHHILVPKHIKLSEEEKNELLSKYRVKLLQLLRIQKDDPISKYCGLRKGDIVKIIRNSETAGRYATYRACT